MKKPRPRWDVYRKIAVWSALLMPISIAIFPLVVGVPMFSSAPAPGSALSTAMFLIYPALISGAVSGSRFFALYAGYAERDRPTDALSAADAERGAEAAYRPVGDWIRSSILAGLSGGLVLAMVIAPRQEHDPMTMAIFGLILFPLLAFTVAMGWLLGALIGTGISVFLSGALGIAFGLSRRKDRHGRVTWAIIASWLPLLLISAVGALGVSLGGGSHYSGDAWLFLAGASIPGAGFAFGSVVLVICRIAFWITVVGFLALIAIGTPALLERLGYRHSNSTPRRVTQ